MVSKFEAPKFEKYPISTEGVPESIAEFNSALRQSAEAKFGAPIRGVVAIDRVNEMKGLLDLSALPIDDIEDETDPLIAADTLLELIRGYLASGGQMYLRGQVYEPADLDAVDIRAQYTVDLTAQLEIVFLEIQWDTLVDAIKERRFVVDPNPYAELFALTTDDSTVIGELLFSDEPSAQGFMRANTSL